MSLLYEDTVTVLRAPLTVDRYGNSTVVRDWTHAVPIVVSGVSFQPASVSDEATGDRSTVTNAWKLFTQRGSDIDLLPTDRIEFQGVISEVKGEVARYRIGGRIHHVEALTERVS